MGCGQNVGLRLVGLFGLLVNDKSDNLWVVAECWLEACGLVWVTCKR
jgi:hypothetical protein